MPLPSAEHVDMTAIIKNILDNYPSGSAVIREFLQNSDDCGATKQTFYLDTRQLSTSHLVDPKLAPSQGPAILAVNNGNFKPEDWDAIQSVMQSSKGADKTATGKYGLGFRSSYHVTDTPQVLSGATLLIMDPHHRMADYKGGVKLLTTDNDIERYLGHFKAFDTVLKVTDGSYEGTAFRLPLRVDASESRIKSTPTTVEMAGQMFSDFIKNDLAECMLFLKHVVEIELIRIDSDATHVSLARAARRRFLIPRPRTGSTHYEVTVDVRGGDTSTSTEAYRWLMTRHIEAQESTLRTLSGRLNRTEGECEKEMRKEKLLPHVALALPHPRNPASFKGRLFTLLPLPIFAQFPLHINAVFALTSSRQNLRTHVDVASISREEFLVEWNRVIFSHFVPKAWAAMLQHIAEEIPTEYNISDAWPIESISKEGDQGYWEPLPMLLLEEAGLRPIWGEEGSMVTLDRVLVAPADGHAPVSTLQACMVPVTGIPPAIAQYIRRSEKYASQIVTPAAVHSHLKANNSSITTLSLDDLNALRDYMSSTGDGSLLRGLRMFRDARGHLVAISDSAPRGQPPALVTSDEASLFGDADCDLVLLQDIPPTTLALLTSTAPAGIHVLSPADVARYIRQRFDHSTSSIPTISNDITASNIDWLCRFWNWANAWKQAAELLDSSDPSIVSYFAIPLKSGSLRRQVRRCNASALSLSGSPGELLNALEAIGVPLLHPDVHPGPAINRIVKSQADLPFILNSLSSSSTSITLDQAACRSLRDFVVGLLSRSTVLPNDQQGALCNLPIFPILQPGDRSPTTTEMKTISNSNPLFVDGSVTVIPNDSEVYVDAVDGQALAAALGLRTRNEVYVLEKAVGQWDVQEEEQDLLVERIMSRLRDLSPKTREAIKKLEIVDVDGDDLACPSAVVDPASPIAILYDSNDRKLPAGRFAIDSTGSPLHQLRSYGMLCNSLTVRMVEELLKKIVGKKKSPEMRRNKALALLRLLDEPSAMGILQGITASVRKHRWLPVGDEFFLASQCWDSRESDAKLCDLVRPRVLGVVRTPALRDALGWTTPSFETLKLQLVQALQTDSSPHSTTNSTTSAQRVVAVLQELATRRKSDQLSELEIQELATAVQSYSWVPVTDGRCAYGRHATLEQVDLGARFRQVHPALLVPGVAEILVLMGVTSRPARYILVDEVRWIAEQLPHSSERMSWIQSALLILSEIVSLPDDGESTDLRVPTTDEDLSPISSVVYNDLPHTPDPFTNLKFAHPLVSRALAGALGLQMLSAEIFNQDQDGMEEFDVQEDLSKRVKSVLTSYDINYASNEWVANASDAGASEVKFLLDEKGFPGLSWDFAPDLPAGGPALVIFNDGVFTENDFDGLKKIGQGGKEGDRHAIGRFGLGALSLFHFTELAMVVSANSVVLLDPSAQYLPRKGVSASTQTAQQQAVHFHSTITSAGRTGVKMDLASFRRKFPGHLETLDGLFGFDKNRSFFKGTLFRLPLRQPNPQRQNLLSDRTFSAVDLATTLEGYFGPSRQSLFFSDLKTIEAHRRVSGEKLVDLWCVSGLRIRIPEGEDTSLRLELRVGERETPTQKWEENWDVCVNRVSYTEYASLLDKHRLPEISTVAIALMTQALPKDVTPLASSLFATLPLPIITSLPAHVHAKWILADDRRALRYDVVDGTDQPLDIKYNDHILRNHIPPLYLRALQRIASAHPEGVKWAWPNVSSDLYSRRITAGVYADFPTTTQDVLRTVTNDLIAPNQAFIHTSGVIAVRELLEALSVPNLVTSLPFGSSKVASTDWAGLRTDTAMRVAPLLRNNVEGVRERCTTAAIDIDSVIRYLLTGKESLHGVPLLQLGNGDITIFQPPTAPRVFCSYREKVAELFGADRILAMGPVYRGETIELLEQAKTNVTPLDTEGMRQLIRAKGIEPGSRFTLPPTEVNWLEALLRFLSGQNAPVPLGDLSNFPLIPTLRGDHTISMDHASDDDVWCSSPPYDDSIMPILRHLQGISIALPINGNRVNNRPIDLPNVLRILRNQLPETLQGLYQAVGDTEWNNFTLWIKSRLVNDLPNPLEEQDRNTIMSLPLFTPLQSQKWVPFAAARNVHMLPAQITTAEIAQYLRPDTTYVAYSSELQAVIRHAEGHRMLSTQDVIERLSPPTVLARGIDTEFSSIISLVATHHFGEFHHPLIPDRTRHLRTPNQLYDHRVQVFEASFRGRTDMFIETSFQGMIDHLVPLGVHRHVWKDDLLRCMRVVDQDTRLGLSTLERAQVLWQFVSEFNDLRRLPFYRLADLRFIPVNRQRHSWSFDFDSFAKPINAVASPQEVYLPQHESILWTQRARVSQPPNDIFLAVYPTFGAPTVVDVVQHLVVLATEVSVLCSNDMHHTNDRLLLRDLRETYNWLQNHSDDDDAVRLALRDLVDQPLWLNAEDPPAGLWQWRSAAELVIDLEYDEGDAFDVRPFLKNNYTNLLLAAGARKYDYGLPEEVASPADPTVRIADGFRELRSQQLLFDVQFEVTEGTVGAHRALLAAVVPHFRTAFTGEFEEGAHGAMLGYPMEGRSVSALTAVMDFIYDGKVEYARPENGIGPSVLLDEMLDVMSLADYLGMDDLKLHLIQTMVSLKLLRSDTIMKCDVLGRAQACQSPELEAKCQYILENNPWPAPQEPESDGE